MATIFSRIANGEIPSYKIAEDEKHYAFLDINPVAPGHVLVIPRREDDYIFNLPESDYADLMAFARRVAKSQEKAISCKRVGMAVIGLEVPHTHIHLIPINSEADMDFSKKIQLQPEEMTAIAAAIAEKFE
ncbi:MAG: HIT family protein [Duncaniella sp.]|nr:HIT family protein [Duncaniella sp.]